MKDIENRKDTKIYKDKSKKLRKNKKPHNIEGT